MELGEGGAILLDEDEARVRIREYVDSGDWWIFPFPDERMQSVVATVEERSYSGEANADFHLMAMAPQLVLVFAHKRRMTSTQFAELLEEVGVTDEEAIAAVRAGHGDILTDPTSDNATAVEEWRGWLTATPPSSRLTALKVLVQAALYSEN
jgi:hypothetical protein